MGHVIGRVAVMLAFTLLGSPAIAFQNTGDRIASGYFVEYLLGYEDLLWGDSEEVCARKMAAKYVATERSEAGPTYEGSFGGWQRCRLLTRFLDGRLIEVSVGVPVQGNASNVLQLYQVVVDELFRACPGAEAKDAFVIDTERGGARKTMLADYLPPGISLDKLPEYYDFVLHRLRAGTLSFQATMLFRHNACILMNTDLGGDANQLNVRYVADLQNLTR